uniref:Uncharacterized protein n=1 Tax=Arundo donax TaxID=35708 RepID=A0A0A9H0N2_ARUDO
MRDSTDTYQNGSRSNRTAATGM